MLNRNQICEVEGCISPVRSVGMCKTHRQRFLEYGRLHKVMSGVKIKHPLYGMWNKRRQIKNSFCNEWLDFYIFINAVGEKPNNHFLARLDENKPCGPDNFEWRLIKCKKLSEETLQEHRSRRAREIRKANPTLSRSQNYKYNFNLTIEQYNNMLWNQNGVCAICKEKETATYKNTGIIRNLAVDHCHKTNKIRELLCSKCNHILGRIKESTKILNNMILYLEKHHG